MNELFKFYRDRITACPKYGFKSGHEILHTICRTAFYDSALTDDEFNSIIILCEKVHIMMLEEDYNAGWNE